jgi:cytochrome c peroxidase
MLASLLVLVILGLVSATAQGGTHPGAGGEVEARRALALRLFADERFANPVGDFATACASCHKTLEDPQGPRAHTDFLARSWMPWRAEDPRRDQARNSPTLLDVADEPSLHLDGEFLSLEALVRGTLAGRPLGWLAGEEAAAFQRLATVVRSDPAYREGFSTLGLDLAMVSDVELIERVTTVLSEHLRQLRSPRDSAWDRFATRNELPPEPAAGEAPEVYASRLLELVAERRASSKLTLGDGFDARALDGLELFFRTQAAEGPQAVESFQAVESSQAVKSSGTGSCVSCHSPPRFADGAFHDLGVSQAEYEALHGDGSFVRLELPAPSHRPVARLTMAPERRDPLRADLGRWNTIVSPRPEDLERAVAAFKTPPLRNLAFSSPYMHNGRYSTVEDAILAHVRAAAAMRSGTLRNGDPMLVDLELGPGDIAALAAFLATLGDRLYGAEPPALPRPTVRGDGIDRYPRY